MSDAELKRAVRNDIGLVWYLFGFGIDVSTDDKTELGIIRRKFIEWNSYDSISSVFKELEDI